MPLRTSRRQSWVVIILGVVLLAVALAGVGLIGDEYRAIYYAQPIAEDDAQSSFAVAELPRECRPIAHQLVDGRTVLEEGY
jgi:hypothetical protein